MHTHTQHTYTAVVALRARRVDTFDDAFGDNRISVTFNVYRLIRTLSVAHVLHTHTHTATYTRTHA